MSRKPETVFRSTTVKKFLLTLKNTYAIPVQQVSIRGTPDFLLCMGGLFVGLELKAKGGRLSALQKHALNRIELCGGIGLEVNPDNWGIVKEKLIILDKKGKLYE